LAPLGLTFVKRSALTIGKSAPSQPAAPDPYETAEAQYTFNKKAFEDVLRQGTLDQNGPSGSVTYARDANGNPTGVNTNLSPELQGAFGSAVGAANSQLGLLPTGAFNSNVDGSGIRDAFVQQGLANVEDLWDRQDDARNVTYSERGLPMGSEIWANSEREVGKNRNDYLGALSRGAWDAGAQEEQRQYQNQLTEYGLPATMASNALNIGSGILGMAPGANPLPIQNLQPGDYAGTANRNYAAAMSQYNQDAANQSAGMGNFLKFGGSLLAAPMTGGGSLIGSMFSDERLKEHIEPIGELHDGQEPLPIYEWSYKGDPERHIGPMAQDVAETNPELVHRHPSGYLMLDANAPTRPSLAALLRHGF
jgi:hypothetical protein